MKRNILSGAALALAALTLVACAGPAGDPASQPDSDGAGGGLPSVAHNVAGSLGDQSFLDDAESGIQALAADGSETTTVQGDDSNPAQWRANLETLSNGDWDLIVTGSYPMIDNMLETAPKYPEQKYIFYDAFVDAPNIASITYKQNEGAFLSGVLAALATTNPDLFPKSEGSKVVGMVGGMDIPVINDFAAGFRSGVAAVDPEIKVLVSYVGDFTNSNRAYDQAKAMFEQEGADVVFQVASGAGLGVLQAAEDTDNYAIGVDLNQNDFNPGFILASMLKNVGASIQSAVADYKAGTLVFGAVTAYGLANNGVSLTFENNSDIVPQEIQDEVDRIAQLVISGEIVVDTVF